MKTVLVSQRLIQAQNYDEIREVLDVRLIAFLQACGYLAIPVSYIVPVRSYEDCRPSAIVLSGGNDLAVCNPADPLNRIRDEFETLLLRYAQDHELPVIGICRGMQMIAHDQGGKLAARAGHVKTHHKIEFSPSSDFRRIYGTEAKVNSYHQYAVTETGKDLEAAARAHDGTIEALQHKSLPVFGMMWHPERNDPFYPKDIDFFKNVLDVRPALLRGNSR